MCYSVSSRSAKFPDEPLIMLNGQPLERVENFKFLGFNINQHLNWKTHITDILSKIQRNLCVVRKIARFLNRNTLLQLYHSLVMSHIRYGIVVWHHSHIAIRKKIQACANKFLRVIFFLKPRESVRPIMKEHNILSVNQIFHLEVSKIMQKHSLKSIPAPFLKIFQARTRTSSTSTRSGTSVIPAPSSTLKCAQSIRCIGPKIWNNVPKEIRFMPTNNTDLSNLLPHPLKSFVLKMKGHAIQNIDFI